MRKIKKSNVKAAQSVVAMANCPCGACTCRGCNVGSMGPHEYEVGSNALSAAIKAGYYKNQ